jgi:O-antigen ligase
MEEASQQWRLRLLSFGLLFTVAVLAAECRQRLLAMVVLGAVCLAAAFNWWDALRPYLFVPVGIEGGTAGRGAGLFINANAAAAFVTAGTIVALPFVPMRFRAMLLLLAFVGIAPTVSRSGFVCAAFIMALAIAFRLIDRAQLLTLLVAAVALCVAAALYYDLLLSSSDDANVHRIVERLMWFQDLQNDDSIDDRIYPALRAWEMFLDAPLMGKGVGVTSIPSLGDGTHNMYLMLMAEQGLTGLLLYVSLIALLAHRGWILVHEAVTRYGADLGRALVLYAGFVAAYGLFSHNVLEEPHSIFLMAFLFTSATQTGSAFTATVAVNAPDASSVERWRRASGMQGRT